MSKTLLVQELIEWIDRLIQFLEPEIKGRRLDCILEKMPPPPLFGDDEYMNGHLRCDPHIVNGLKKLAHALPTYVEWIGPLENLAASKPWLVQAYGSDPQPSLWRILDPADPMQGVTLAVQKVDRSPKLFSVKHPSDKHQLDCRMDWTFSRFDGRHTMEEAREIKEWNSIVVDPSGSCLGANGDLVKMKEVGLPARRILLSLKERLQDGRLIAKSKDSSTKNLSHEIKEMFTASEDAAKRRHEGQLDAQRQSHSAATAGIQCVQVDMRRESKARKASHEKIIKEISRVPARTVERLAPIIRRKLPKRNPATRERHREERSVLLSFWRNAKRRDQGLIKKEWIRGMKSRLDELPPDAREAWDRLSKGKSNWKPDKDGIPIWWSRMEAAERAAENAIKKRARKNVPKTKTT